ncbi:TRAP transporter small permease [Chromohalobacter sp. HP20-39]|uniref:TRAP transporter small permease n=1 Tax=Chromohalobacter sp. HP20-39 TaxID=3079306 RepID=UPI00294ADB72|nr:TRAP transporter small permease [Chromohalobacter sp. HP20-39]MDV6318223.1 TRAP transporter small permease [Chromohalobacter sp. HP20-39]
MSRFNLTKPLNLVRRLIDWLARLVVLATTISIGLTLMAGVIVRYVLSSSLAWSAELPLILFPWLVMGGIVMAAVQHEHLGVDYVVRQLPAKAQRIISVAMQALIAVTMATLIVQSQPLLQFMQYQTTPVLGWSATVAFYSLPAGALCLTVLSVLDAIELCLPNDGNGTNQQTSAGELPS